MTLAKVHPGQPLRMSAEAYNAFVDAATAYQASRQNRASDGTSITSAAGIIPVRNDSGAAQERFAVLGLGDPLIAPSANERAFLERVTFSAVAPDQDQHAHRFCVLQEPIAAGALGRALVLGVTPVRLDVQAADDETASVVTATTGSLKSGADGGARILWKEAGTGERWGIVQIPTGGSGGSGSPNLVVSVTASAHGWQLGDVLRWTGTAWALADAAVVGATDTLGVVGKIPDNDTALVVLWGVLCLDGLEPHTDYWLDPVIPGGVTATKPGDQARLVYHHAENRLCVVRAGAAGAGGGAGRFADLTDVDVTSTPPTDRQAALWDAAAERWKPHDVVVADPVPANQVLVGPTHGADAKPAFRAMVLEDLPDLQPCSVVANATNGSLPPTAFAALADDRALVRVGGVLQWLQIGTALIADAAVTDAKIENLGWAKLTGVPTVFPPADHTHPLGGALGGTTTNATIVPGAVGSAQIADGAVSDAKIVSVGWAKITGVPDFTDPTLGGDLTGTAADAQIAAGAVGTPELADGAVTNAKLAKDFLSIGGVDFHLGDTVTGLLTNPMTATGDLIVGGAAGAPQRLAGNPGGTAMVVVAKSGQTSLVTYTLSTLEGVQLGSLVDGQVLTYSSAAGTWQNRAPSGGGPGSMRATSVWANPTAANATGTDLGASADNQALLRLAGTLQWARVPRAALADAPANSVVARGAGAGSPGDLSAPPDTVLVRSGANDLVFAKVTATQIDSQQADEGWAFTVTATGQPVWNRSLQLGKGAGQATSIPGALIVVISTTGDFAKISSAGIELYRRSVSTTTPMVKLDLNAVGTWTAAKAMGIREIDVCDTGVAKKMLILASAPY